MKVPVSVKKVNLVMPWNIVSDPKDEIPNYNCKLCKRQLIAPPLHELQTDGLKDIKIEGKLSKGVCGDIFHEKCITDSIKSGCVSCPTCNITWQKLKTLNSSVLTGNTESITMKKKTSTTVVTSTTAVTSRE